MSRIGLSVILALSSLAIMLFADSGCGMGNEDSIPGQAKSDNWLTNTYGAEDVVLPGFGPLQVEGNTVKLWGRRILFGKSIMPQQIVNQGREMLAGPIDWHVTIAGQEHSLLFGNIQLLSSSQTRAIYKGIGHLGGFDVVATVTVEYDGFMKFEIVFDTRGQTIHVDKLYMDIPFVESMCTNFYHPTRTNGSWEEGWDSALDLAVTNIITLGTPDICLQWLTESDQYYYPRGYESSLQTFSQDAARIFRTNVIAEKRIVSTPVRLVFALHAGPVKPRPPKWRGWTMNGRKYIDPERHVSIAFDDAQWSIAPGSLVPANGFPENPQPNTFQDSIKPTSMHFIGTRQKKLLPPWWVKHGAQWRRLPVPEQEQMPPDKTGWTNMYVDTNSTWAQWHVYNCKKLFDSTGIRGLYYDNSNPGTSTNQAAGSGYIDEDDKLRPTYPIFSQREIHRRVYAIVHKARPENGVVIIRTAGTILLPAVSFCDVIYNGDILLHADLTPPVPPKAAVGNFLKTFSNGLFQSVFTGRQYGPVPAFNDPSEAYETTGHYGPATLENQRLLWGILLTHDIHAQGGHSTGWEELRLLWLDEFDIADPAVKFHPYADPAAPWDTNPAAKITRAYMGSVPPETYSGLDLATKFWSVAYSKPGKSLIVVVRDAPDNYSGPTAVEIALDRKRLRLPTGPLRVTDLEAFGRAPKFSPTYKVLARVEGDILTVPVGQGHTGDDISAVVVQAEPGPMD